MQEKDKKIRLLRGIYRALIAVSRNLGYKFHLVPGEGGSHAGFLGQYKIIKIGKDQNLEDKIVFLSHEIGHALDFIHNTPKVEEIIFVLKNWEAYRLGKQYYLREKEAWKHAKTMLENMGGHKIVGARFGKLRARSLKSYYKQLQFQQYGNPITNT